VSGALHDDALTVLTGWAAPDADQERLRLEFVAHLHAHPDALRRSCRPDHLTASTLVLSADHSEVLLTLHAKAGRWFQMGGHCEPQDSSLAGAALREAAEESGIANLAIDPRPVHLDAHDVPFCGAGDGRHLDVRFLAVAPPGTAPAATEESLEVRWWPVTALPTDEPSIRALVSLALRRAQSATTVDAATSPSSALS
jgi:8-oxo-dGTP pyrophosphatase MutT (NUDIX family)